MQVSVAQLDTELVRLRRGWGLQADGLRNRLGPGLTELCHIHGSPNDAAIRHHVGSELTRLAADFPADMRIAIGHALGIDHGVQLAHLRDRIAVLAQTLRCSERTARRRVDTAFARLAETALRNHRAEEEHGDPAKGWQVRRLRSLLRLDGDAPELIEERTIVALRDDLDRIAVRFSLPPTPNDAEAGPDLLIDVQRGARLERSERQGRSHFHYTLALPRPLNYGEEHTYTIVFGVAAGQRIRDHYAFVPLVPCEEFHLVVRFDLARRPESLWRLRHLAPRQLDEGQPTSELLELDGAGEVTLDFAQLEQGFAYGVGWRPAGTTSS
ncbi:hypothetical protein F4553_003025 [Allocatelliglobosispora scoriae]|uniref:Uncharacterized protein n=1 Tax=Allocatelliglobosispora scoriae TaxID=643052 RepID=A0A841BQN1_9ACTN|nr:hypothetical protein [Allocatelliglobosispora scoriae]MBB5869646.1 hypothetical protein [Allocatelliglobosispora scoriae]